jgi:hypothetical protein
VISACAPITGSMESHQTVRLGVGKHDGPGREVCVMELASMLAGERFSDRPASVCPVIGSILRFYNDNLSHELRGDLYRYAAEAVGTRVSFKLQCRRAELALAWARPRHETRRRLRRPADPDPYWSPDLIAEYVVGSLGRRVGADAHRAMLGLLDQLIALGLEGELVEQIPHAVEHGRGDQQILVAESGERGAPARLELLSAPLDERSADVGQRRQHDTPVLV